jgi:F-type H+-transporting ATPase subunit a
MNNSLLNNIQINEYLSPLDQFEIREILSFNNPVLNLNITNMVIYLITSFFIIIILNAIINKSRKVIYNNWSINNESVYDTIHGIVTSQINKYSGQIYFPFIYSLFLFILINNLIGLVPYSFATTSHFVLTFSLSFTIVLGVTILGFYIHNIKFFSFFVPSGCPLALLPALVLIEFISYLARNISLGLRLAANILSGHMLLNILSGFTFKIMSSGLIYLIVGLLPLTFIIAFSSLELGIAFIQAQVFVVLTCSYIKDSLDLH